MYSYSVIRQNQSGLRQHYLAGEDFIPVCIKRVRATQLLFITQMLRTHPWLWEIKSISLVDNKFVKWPCISTLKQTNIILPLVTLYGSCLSYYCRLLPSVVTGQVIKGHQNIPTVHIHTKISHPYQKVLYATFIQCLHCFFKAKILMDSSIFEIDVALPHPLLHSEPDDPLSWS